ncbi:MAG: hypothetical protein ABRQ39_23200 [Candidatus Eremiobacterota bacterium]
MADEVKEFCPFISNPSDKCYCFRLISRNINSFLYYCGKNFEKCEIYEKLKSNLNSATEIIE